MKVGIDISPAVYGTGISNYVIDLVAHLPSTDVIPFGYSLRRKSELRTLFPTGKIFPVPPSAMDYLWNRLHLLNVENLIGPIDVYHSSDWAQAPSHARKVTTIHDLSPFIFPESDPTIIAVHTRQMKWAIAECDHFICVSQNTAADLQRLFSVPASQISVIYEALPSRFTLKAQLIKHTNYIVAIGARQPRKNIQRLIAACQQLKQKLIIIGEKPSALQLSSSPALTFTGHISDQDLVNYLSGASAFVYPSLYEGFGLTILEAFYHHVPVAASNISSLPEVTGDAAVLFDPYSEESIAAGITQALKDRDRLVTAGIKQLAKFSWETTARETLAVYKSLC